MSKKDVGSVKNVRLKEWSIAVLHSSKQQRGALREVIKQAFPNAEVLVGAPDTFTQASEIALIEVDFLYKHHLCNAEIWLATDESHCLAAIRSGAADYLILPADVPEIQDAIVRAAELVEKRTLAHEFVAVDKKQKVAWRDLEYLEASRNYTTGHLRKGGSVLFNRSLKSVVDDLPARYCVRTHYSYAVNLVHLDHIAFSESTCYMKGGAVIPISEKNKDSVKATLASFLVTV